MEKWAFDLEVQIFTRLQDEIKKLRKFYNFFYKFIHHEVRDSATSVLKIILQKMTDFGDRHRNRQYPILPFLYPVSISWKFPPWKVTQKTGIKSKIKSIKIWEFTNLNFSTKFWFLINFLTKFWYIYYQNSQNFLPKFRFFPKFGFFAKDLQFAKKIRSNYLYFSKKKI